MSRDELKEVVASARVPLYYAGRSFAGLPLSHAETDPQQTFFVYGDCKLSGGEQPSCSPPIQIQLFPFRAHDWALAVGCHRLPSLRGVPTVRHDGLVLVTRTTLVKIFARSAAEEKRVAQALRRVRDDVRPSRLPAPAKSTRQAIADACP